jgi:hypothetical protein
VWILQAATVKRIPHEKHKTRAIQAADVRLPPKCPTAWDLVTAPKTELGAGALVGSRMNWINRQKSETLIWAWMQRILSFRVWGFRWWCCWGLLQVRQFDRRRGFDRGRARESRWLLGSLIRRETTVTFEREADAERGKNFLLVFETGLKGPQISNKISEHMSLRLEQMRIRICSPSTYEAASLRHSREKQVQALGDPQAGRYLHVVTRGEGRAG